MLNNHVTTWFPSLSVPFHSLFLNQPPLLWCLLCIVALCYPYPVRGWGFPYLCIISKAASSCINSIILCHAEWGNGYWLGTQHSWQDEAGKKDRKCNPIQYCADLKMSGERPQIHRNSWGRKKTQLSDLTSALLLSVSSINHDNSSKKYLRIFETYIL